VNITAAIASLSIGGLAVGLAAQDTLANLFGAVAIPPGQAISHRRPDRARQCHRRGGTIGLRSTKFANLDGHLVTIPNKTMGNATLTNITSRPNIKTVMNIGINLRHPGGKSETRAGHSGRDLPRQIRTRKDLLVSFNKFADSA